jgi:hypothetical protein
VSLKRLRRFAFLALLLGTSQLTSAAVIANVQLPPGPFASVTIGTETINLTDLLVAIPKRASDGGVSQVPCIGPLEGFCYELPPTTQQSGEVSTTISAFFNPDPFIDFAVAASNGGAVPIVLVFAFSSPVITPGVVYGTSEASIGLTVTDGNSPRDGASVDYTLDSSVNLGVLDIGVDLAGSCVEDCLGSPTEVCSDFATGAFGPVAVTNLEAVLTVTLSPGDNFSATGRVEIFPTAVPEPTSVMLSLTGLGALLFFVRRRRA